ncbi:hypothetical protein [Chelativorans sp. Marseille-P2723]|uniref:hypothetical protein n=1 Tax=Chelativorans sp. Marseille-P2723 TaxID=2709133 RepID=UPI001570F91C|nr:hypothetical protein [Chelativorans sp. Marseille-P2723]
MTSLLKTTVGALALLGGAGIALAQSGSGSLSTGGMPASMTCADIVDLDRQQAEQRLYFLAGYQAAQQSSGTDTASTATGSALSGSDTASAGSDTSSPIGTDEEATTAMGAEEQETNTTASSDLDTSADTGTDTGTDMASDMTEDDSSAGTDPTTTAGTPSGTSAGGFMDIPVETVMTECENNPDSLVMDILSQQQGGSLQ